MKCEIFWFWCYKFWNGTFFGVKEWFYRNNHKKINVAGMILRGVNLMQKYRSTLFSTCFGQKTDIFEKKTFTEWSKSIDIEVKKCVLESFLGYCQVSAVVLENQQIAAWFFKARRQIFCPFFTKIYNALFSVHFRLQMNSFWLCTKLMWLMWLFKAGDFYENMSVNPYICDFSLIQPS